MTAPFFTAYEKWIEQCQEELTEMGIDPILKSGNPAEICENGQVYFGNLSITAPGYVTPWTQSEFYTQ